VTRTEIVSFEARCARLIVELGLGAEVLAVAPLTGGVASDIARVDLPDGPVCVKFALPKLKVAADWFAPVHRNRAEYEWLAVAGRVAPCSVPQLLGRSDALNGFVMEFLQGDDVYLWKAALLAGAAPRGEAVLVADVLGRVHARSSEPGFDATAFQNRDDFSALRLEPYLRHTASRHPDLAARLEGLADQLYRASTTLVHGDISPKNIMIRDGVPVILDAECATMGDPVFDVAFCLNHLVLKSIHTPAMAGHNIGAVKDFWRAYARYDLRDGGMLLRGLDVGLAVANVGRLIAPALIGRGAIDQAAADAAIVALDPSPRKATLGGNAAVAASLAVLHAGAAARGLPLWAHVAALAGTCPSVPLPEIQIFGGGAHAGRRVDVQDFMVMVPGASTFDEVMEVTSAVYFAAGKIMAQRGKLAGVADEGGWWPQFDSNEEALETLVAAIEQAGEVPGGRVVISFDIAASEFGKAGKYRLALENRTLGSDEMIRLLEGWIDRYPIASIEDPLAEDDPEGMRNFTQAMGERVQIIGDDYLVTNASLVQQAATAGACNAVLIKVNQAGTVSESLATFDAAQRTGFRAVVSARSGETEDTSISHLAVGLGAGQLKVGSFTRSERMAKWGECLRIQEMPGSGDFVGGAPLAHTWWGRTSAGARR
jgi:enolase